MLFPYKALPWLGLAFILLGWTARWIAYHRLTRATPIDSVILLLTILGCFGYCISIVPGLSWPRLWSLIFGIAVYYAIVNWVDQESRLLIAVYLLALMTLAIAILSLFGTDWDKVRLVDLPWLYNRLPNLVRGLPGSGLDPSSELFNPRWPGITLGFLLPFFLAVLLFGANQQLKWVSATVILAGGIVLLLSQSIQGIVALLTGVTFLLIWRWRNLWLIIPVILLLIAGGTFITGIDRVINYLLSDTNPIGIAIAVRLDIWSRALAMLHDLPYTGSGLNAFQAMQMANYPGFSLGSEPHAHNLFLQTALDFGLPGLFTFLWLLIAWGISICRNYHQTSVQLDRVLLAGLAASILAYASHGFLDAMMLGSKPSVAVWFVLGLGVAIPPRTLEAQYSGSLNEDGTHPVRRQRGFIYLQWILPYTVLIIGLMLSLVIAPVALPMNLGAVKAHRALARLEHGLQIDPIAIEAARVSLQRVVQLDPGRIFAFELLGRLEGWGLNPEGGVAALSRRVALEVKYFDPLGAYYPAAAIIRQFGSWSKQQPAELDDLEIIYTNWTIRYPQRAEHITRLALLLAYYQQQPEQARQVLEAGLKAGSMPASLLQAALEELSP